MDHRININGKVVKILEKKKNLQDLGLDKEFLMPKIQCIKTTTKTTTLVN